MSLQELETTDYIRIAKAIDEARRRNASIVPNVADLVSAMKSAVAKTDPMSSWNDLAELLIPVFGETIRPAVELLRTVLAETHGDEYVQELWARFSSK